ncbi:MAG: cysteate synthase [Streptosporangiaceae bacterium]|jgi:cysteate synthase
MSCPKVLFDQRCAAVKRAMEAERCVCFVDYASEPPVEPPVRHYQLVCSECGRQYDDDGLILDCSGDHVPALLRTQYSDSSFNPLPEENGIFRYRRWLPVIRTPQNTGRTAVYRSYGLARMLRLPNLWIAFNGFWPERDAVFETATFKELEAHTVLGRLPDSNVILTVASAGNTGAAFAWACSQRRQPCLLIVPGRSLRRFRFRESLHPAVNLVVIDDGDYPDAIELATAVSRASEFQAEGGVKNVGRRDGLATVLFTAFEEMNQLPTHYFQAVGSGTGAIAVLEAAKRIRNAGVDTMLPRLMLCQNLPFTPIFDAWRMDLKSPAGSADKFREDIRQVYADELTNWAPPYTTKGGVRDSLVASCGEVMATTNAAARLAVDMFSELEGIDIEPAAGVAVACLRDAAAQGKFDKEAVVLLNITGGGRLRLEREYSLVPAEPRLRLIRKSISVEAVQQVAAHCP